MAVAVIIWVVVGVAVVVAAIWSLFYRRHRESDQPAVGWQRTSEVFNDPSTNRVMRVYLDSSGERHYVAEENRPAT